MSCPKGTGYLQSEQQLGVVTRNIGTMFLGHRDRIGSMHAFAERRAGAYRYFTWENLVDGMLRVAAMLSDLGFAPGDRIAIVSANSYERLVVEMALMGRGLVSVPIFGGYPKALICELIGFSKAKGLVCDAANGVLDWPDLGKDVFKIALNGEHPQALSVDEIQAQYSPEHPLYRQSERAFGEVSAKKLAMVMFTSGTSGFPKGVQLTHENLMSQQRALTILWKPDPGMRFLCYLPWHHSFGGLFERFCALHSGGCLAVDDSGGKNIDRLLVNFKEIRPHIFFSVPKIFQEIVSRMLVAPELESVLFHADLKFVFTAAAPLPMSTSDVFRKRGVPVVEGWGLTETSPCCTLTPLLLDRSPGVVGLPIPGVEIRLGAGDEISVRGPNVMLGYLDNAAANESVFEPEGWLRTGDIGEITPAGLRILSRCDRMFKLNNGEKVFPAVIEERLRARCPYVKHAYVFGRGQTRPLALIFPNHEMFAVRAAAGCTGKSCHYPAGYSQMSECLKSCLGEINNSTAARFEKIARAAVVVQEPTLERGEITPSFKLVPRAIEDHFGGCIEAVEQDHRHRLPKEAVWIELEPEKNGKG